MIQRLETYIVLE